MTIGAAIVGTGFMGATHARAARAAGGRVLGALGSRPERSEQAAESVGAEQGFKTLGDLLADPAVDVVHICTPNSSHEGIALAAIKAGKHVICEKPLATTGKAAQRIASAAKAAGVIGTVPFVYRFHPLLREVRSRVAAGELGVATLAHGSYLQDWLAAASDTNWRVNEKEGGSSRAFADIGSHWCDAFEFISGQRISAVSAQFTTPISRRAGREVTTEDVAVVQFRTSTGMPGSLVVAQVAAGRKNRLHIELSGTHTSFSFDQESPERVWQGGIDSSRVIPRDPAHLSPDARRLSFLPAGHPQGYQDAFNAFVADTYAAIRGQQPEGLPTLSAGLRAARICDAVIDSAHSKGEWRDIDD